MKIITLLLFIASISLVKSTLDGFTDKWCDDYENKKDENHQAFSKGFCMSLAVNNAENKCCYIKYKTDNGTFYNCAELAPSQFYNIKEYKRAFESKYGDVKTIECDSSSYLYGSFLLILVLLF